MALTTKIILGLIIIEVIELIVIIMTWVRTDDVKVVRPPNDFDKYIVDVLREKYEDALTRYHDLKVKLDQVSPKYFDVTYREFKAAETELNMFRERIALEQERAK